MKLCSSCKGTGAAPGAIEFCNACQGTGERITRAQVFAGGPLVHIRQPCGRCHGTGQIITKLCSQCQGHRSVLRSAQIEVPIHSGAKTGDIIRIHGQGNHAPEHAPGDVVFTINVPSNFGQFNLIGNNVTVSVQISLREALLGFHRSIKHIDDSSVQLDRLNQVTKPDTVVFFKGKGWPHARDGSPTGDLLVTFEIDFPTSISNDNIALLKRSFQ
jgi:DnaJ-class molecular chaperone